MARYSRRIRVVRKYPKKKWSPFEDSWVDIRGISQRVYEARENIIVCWGQIVDNSTQSSTPTPGVLKVGNFRVTADAAYAVNPNTTVTAACYMVYVPERWLEPDYNQQQTALKLGEIPTTHPEWILARGILQSETSSGGTGTMLLNSPSKSFSSRLKRNLQTGDSIYYLWVIQAASTNGTTGSQIHMTTCTTHVRCYTCFN